MSEPPRRVRREFPLWLLLTALLGVVGLWAIVSDRGYAQILTALSGGIVTTIWVTLVAFGLAALLGLLIALARTSRIYLLRQMATFYVEIVRGIPVLVFLFYVAFVGAPWIIDALNVMLSPLTRQGWMEPLRVRDFDFTWRAIVALTVCYAAFIAEIFRAGIEAIDKGQVEAARALGLSPWQTFRLVVAPQALRTILPPLGNDLVSMIKDSALVSALGVQDITQIGKVYSAGTFKFFETYNVVAFLYLTMTIGLSLLIRLLERRLQRSRR
ncbi:MAG TPA: amino acid ABC transporter permease [Devosia sp.]|nr:amino acid ABC transporter permease [Devosia sp.]